MPRVLTRQRTPVPPLFSLRSVKPERVVIAHRNIECADPRTGFAATALHYAASTPSPEVLEILLETEGTDVDLQNRLDKATPLHLAAQLEHPAARQGVMEMLLDAGADPKIKDKHGSLPVDYLHPDESEEDQQIIAIIDQSFVDATLIDDADIAEDDDEEEGGGSESD